MYRSFPISSKVKRDWLPSIFLSALPIPVKTVRLVLLLASIPPPPLPPKNCNCKRFTAGKERPGRDVVSKRISRELFLLDNKEFVPTLEPIYARYDSGSGIRQVSLEKVRRDRWRMFVVIERRSKVLEEPSSLPLPLLFLKRYYVPINFQIPCRIDVS